MRLPLTTSLPTTLLPVVILLGLAPTGINGQPIISTTSCRFCPEGSPNAAGINKPYPFQEYPAQELEGLDLSCAGLDTALSLQGPDNCLAVDDTTFTTVSFDMWAYCQCPNTQPPKLCGPSFCPAGTFIPEEHYNTVHLQQIIGNTYTCNELQLVHEYTLDWDVCSSNQADVLKAACCTGTGANAPIPNSDVATVSVNVTFTVFNTDGLDAEAVALVPENAEVFNKAFTDFAESLVIAVEGQQDDIRGLRRLQGVTALNAALYAIEDVDCPTDQQPPIPPTASCQNVFGQIELGVTDDPLLVQETYASETEKALEEGKLQESLDKTDPISAFTVHGVATSDQSSGPTVAWVYRSESVAPITLIPTTTAPTVTIGSPSSSPTTTSPTTARPTTARPTTARPTTARPTTATPTVALGSPSSSPTTSRPTTARPTTARPTTARPTTLNPTTLNPTTVRPTTANPTTARPTTARPTTANPTTANPTTARPTTARPTTTNPTTSSPTTARPTTARPTTSRPTTSRPTTTSPTIFVPATFSPTTSSPTTVAPTTANPTVASASPSASPTIQPTTSSAPTGRPSSAPSGEPTLASEIPSAAPVSPSPTNVTVGPTPGPSTKPPIRPPLTPRPTASGTPNTTSPTAIPDLVRLNTTFLMYTTDGLTSEDVSQPGSAVVLNRAFQDFVSNLVEDVEQRKNLSQRSLRWRTKANRRLQVTLQTGSVAVYGVQDVACPANQEPPIPIGSNCVNGYGRYALEVLDEDPLVVYEQYTTETEEALEEGKLQESLDMIDPDFPFNVAGPAVADDAPGSMPTEAPMPLEPPANEDDKLEWWLILIIVLSSVLGLCCIASILYYFLMGRKKSVEEDVEASIKLMDVEEQAAPPGAPHTIVEDAYEDTDGSDEFDDEVFDENVPPIMGYQDAELWREQESTINVVQPEDVSDEDSGPDWEDEDSSADETNMYSVPATVQPESPYAHDDDDRTENLEAQSYWDDNVSKLDDWVGDDATAQVADSVAGAEDIGLGGDDYGYDPESEFSGHSGEDPPVSALCGDAPAGGFRGEDPSVAHPFREDPSVAGPHRDDPSVAVPCGPDPSVSGHVGEDPSIAHGKDPSVAGDSRGDALFPAKRIITLRRIGRDSIEMVSEDDEWEERHESNTVTETENCSFSHGTDEGIDAEEIGDESAEVGDAPGPGPISSTEVSTNGEANSFGPGDEDDDTNAGESGIGVQTFPQSAPGVSSDDAARGFLDLSDEDGEPWEDEDDDSLENQGGS